MFISPWTLDAESLESGPGAHKDENTLTSTFFKIIERFAESGLGKDIDRTF